MPHRLARLIRATWGLCLATAAWTDAGRAALPAAAPRDLGLPLIRTFGTRDYNEHAQNWAVTQDADGLLYVGNNNGVVLTFDGSEWRPIQVASPGAPVRGLEFDSAGRLWVGATGSVGYLQKDGRGGFAFTSLADRLPPDVRNDIVMYHVAVQPDGVFFFTSKYVLRWDGAKFSVERLRAAWPSRPGGRLLRHGANRPLEEWKNGAWRVLADLPELRRDVVRFATILSDGSLLLALGHGGMVRLVDGRLVPWPTQIDAFLHTAGVERGLRLRDGGIVLSHRPQGFSILGPDGSLRHYVSADNSPLPTSVTWAFHEDPQNHLWVMLDNGLAVLSPDNGFTYFGQMGGPRWMGANAFGLYQDQLYIGTPNGLLRVARSAPGAIPPRDAHLEAVSGVTEDIRTLGGTTHGLLLGTPSGLKAWRGDGDVPRAVISGKHVSRLWISSLDPDYGLAGTLDGAIPLHADAAGWHAGPSLPGIATEIRAITQDSDGALWLAVLNQGYDRVVGLPGTPGGGGGAVRIEPYPEAAGLRFGAATRIATLGGRTHFLVQNRPYHFDPPSRRFVGDPPVGAAIGEPDAEVSSYDDDLCGSLWTVLRRSDSSGWPAQGKRLFRIDPDGTVTHVPYRAYAYAGANLAVMGTTGEPGREGFWLMGSDGLIRIEAPAILPPSPPFRVRLTRIADASGHDLPLDRVVRLPFASRKLSYRVATNQPAAPLPRFQSRLGNEPWSEWSDQPQQSVDRLPIGSFEIQVRARDADGNLTLPAGFAVTVLPPWWQTWWAYALDAAALAGAIGLLVRSRDRALRRRNEKLEELVAARTSDLQAREHELLEARDHAEAANRAKSVFLASMSHELRTPLNAILGYAQLLSGGSRLPEAARRQLDTIRASGEHLLELVNDVLDLAKIEAGKIELHPRPTSLSRLLAHLTEVFEPRAGQKRIAFVLHVESPLPDLVLVDDARLRQVLYNLLGNAIKFTETGRIELRIAAAESGVRFTVVDTGIGIAPAEQRSIFGLFHQAAPALAAQGAGLGLAISQRIVRLMGGEIVVVSEPGRGSSFSFELALPEAAAPEAPVPPRAPSGYRGARRRILVVDDEPVNRAVLRDLLVPLGFVVADAQSGEDAIAQVSDRMPDLILMDLRLRGEDGLATTRRLRRLPAAAGLSIVAISASVFPLDRTQALEAGCDGFEPKPFAVPALLETIGRLLGLEWEWEDTFAPVPPPESLPRDWALPPARILAELAEHGELGDMAAIRAALAQAKDRHPGASPFLEALGGFAAKAEAASLRKWLAAAAARAEPDPS